VEEITRMRPLTHAEEKELKRQKRLIKNRESAQASRQRKKSYIDELEAEITKLKQENGFLNSQVGNLSVENRTLREELNKIQTLVKKTGASIINTMLPRSVSGQTPSKPMEHPVVGSSISPRGPTQKAKAGVCLLILLFSFGLFFNAERGPVKPVSPANAIARILEATPAMAAGSAKMFLHGDRGAANGGRKLLEADIHSIPPDAPQVEKPSFETATSSFRQAPHKITINDKQRPDYKQSVTAPASSYHEEVAHRTRDKEAHLGVNFMEFMNESINSNVSEMEDAEVKKWFSDRLRIRPNTAFFSVSDFQQIIPPNVQPFDSNAPFFVSLLVPASSFVNQLPSGSHLVDDSVIEVVAQVVDVNRTSLNLGEVMGIRQVPIVA